MIETSDIYKSIKTVLENNFEETIQEKDIKTPVPPCFYIKYINSVNTQSATEYIEKNSQIYNDTKDSNGEYLERGWGTYRYKNGATSYMTNGDTLYTISTTLSAGELYYISFAATKNTATSNSGTFVITDITTIAISTDNGTSGNGMDPGFEEP